MWSVQLCCPEYWPLVGPHMINWSEERAQTWSQSKTLVEDDRRSRKTGERSCSQTWQGSGADWEPERGWNIQWGFEFHWWLRGFASLVTCPGTCQGLILQILSSSLVFFTTTSGWHREPCRDVCCAQAIWLTADSIPSFAHDLCRYMNEGLANSKQHRNHRSGPADMVPAIRQLLSVEERDHKQQEHMCHLLDRNNQDFTVLWRTET